MAQVFTDLATLLAPLQGSTVPQRVQEVQTEIPWTTIIAIGGFPITTEHNKLHWCGSAVTPERVLKEVVRGFGCSALLTYMNKSQLDYDRLGEICLQKSHDWAGRWMTFSVLFVGFGLEAELAFNRDTRFLMSWPVGDLTGTIYAATTSLKEWGRFLAHRESSDWSIDSRRAMLSAYDTMSFLPRGPS